MLKVERFDSMPAEYKLKFAICLASAGAFARGRC